MVVCPTSNHPRDAIVIRYEIAEHESLAKSELTELVSKLVAQNSLGFHRTKIQPLLAVGDAETDQQLLHKPGWNRWAIRFGEWSLG